METLYGILKQLILSIVTCIVILAPLDVHAASIWPSTSLPANVDAGGDSPVELGVKFRADSDGSISAIRFFKSAANNGPHTARLWSSSGQLLATATFASETASGWQQANFPAPVAVTASTVYIASYHTATGHYSYDYDYFSGTGVDSPPLHALQDGISGANGVYAYGPAGTFPASGWKSSNYWVDVVYAAGASGTSIWPYTALPDNIDAGADSPVELGVKFRADTNGTISSIRFYKSPANNGPHTARLWNSSGGLLATATFANETASGWQQADFPTPIAINANSVYIASYHTDTGHYSYTKNYFSGSGADNPPLHAPADGVSGANGVFAYGPAGSFPAGGWNGTNYWVDVLFSPGGSGTPFTGIEPPGWYTGDMHVHRSCGGPPETLDDFLPGMAPHNLSVISLLADSGNAEVKIAPEDLPRINGSDDPSSAPGRIIHWDTEWHWDANYQGSSHQALGGHVVALGLSEAHQIWEEYTYPVFNWAHQQNGIAGFAHMQYLNNNGLPDTLNCCTPVEYPVEVALGESDFISEDVMDVSSSYSFMCPDCAMQAYYRLLNCGFRPGLAAGTDYPCNDTESKPLGALLTYVKPVGELSYRSWIEGIAKGRTVVSRNGHNEFLDFMVNGSAGPGDEIKLAGPASVQVSVQWTAGQSLSGAIELVHNGVVIASKQATVAPGAPNSLNATVNFPKSGWLAARRMGSEGHYVHTGAVFVSVANQPVRASVADAEFYVSWMDGLLQRTSPGGAWSSFFTTSRTAAQDRYRAARSMFQQIAYEAGVTPQQNGSIFTSQTPSTYENDQMYELGTRFSADVSGQITRVKIFTDAFEGGNHTVRIWRVQDGAVVAGPFAWDFAAGSAGWKSFTLPAPLQISANTDYIVAVSNSSDQNYAAETNGFDAPIVNGHLYAPTGAGVWSDVMGDMPTNVWKNTNYFRDVEFVP
ncbi:DUF4082 domain-containing protein [Pelotalea chapellei]|uniref:DUF4082 domain-containing protein n=1 Tax=Pelotalea chapellei TaxID=44671 RepID=A0ABS5U5B4_9BACT|nr:DUF4082 domain-containing protein [Pelotalea chapellei]MBT1070850.1 DUF4082 domain-containing protein [Pelotalea chapellei]